MNSNIEYWKLRAARAEQQLAADPVLKASHDQWIRMNPEPTYSWHDLSIVKDALMVVHPMEASVDDYIDYYMSGHENPDALTDDQVDDIHAAMQYVEGKWCQSDEFYQFMEMTQERLNSLKEDA